MILCRKYCLQPLAVLVFGLVSATALAQDEVNEEESSKQSEFSELESQQQQLNKLEKQHSNDRKTREETFQLSKNLAIAKGVALVREIDGRSEDKLMKDKQFALKYFVDESERLNAIAEEITSSKLPRSKRLQALLEEVEATAELKTKYLEAIQLIDRQNRRIKSTDELMQMIFAREAEIAEAGQRIAELSDSRDFAEERVTKMKSVADRAKTMERKTVADLEREVARSRDLEESVQEMVGRFVAVYDGAIELAFHALRSADSEPATRVLAARQIQLWVSHNPRNFVDEKRNKLLSDLAAFKNDPSKEVREMLTACIKLIEGTSNSFGDTPTDAPDALPDPDTMPKLDGKPVPGRTRDPFEGDPFG